MREAHRGLSIAGSRPSAAERYAGSARVLPFGCREAGIIAMRLIEPAPEWRDAFLEMARDWRSVGDQRYAPAVLNFEGYLRRLDEYRRGEHLPAGRVPSAEFWLEDGEVLLAGLRLRFRLTPELEREGGHIGYDVRPSARRRGYGTQLLALGLVEARARRVWPVLLTANADNVGSIRIIERNGGVFAGEGVSAQTLKPIRRYWIG
jgi:predicted acetyltransferase